MLSKTTLLLILCFFALLAVFKEVSLRFTKARWGNRDSFLFASITQATIIVLLTEGLSAFHRFQRLNLLVAWSLVLTITFFLFAFLRVLRIGINRRVFNLVDWDLPTLKFNRTTIICYFLIGFQFITLAMVAYVYAPNNWDSMTYHLSRVMHWQQNQSVAIYATNIERQVQSPPFAEYSIANLQMLVGNDRYDNFVQYLAFFACFICVTNITKKLRGSPDQQILAGMISISIPTAILQATGTQNDLVVSLWLACFISMGVSLINDAENVLWVIGIGLSLGLACLTQEIAYILALPFCIWFGVILIKRSPKNITKGLMIAGLILIINSGFLIRNMLIFSNPLGTGIMFQMASHIHSLAELASNVIRNLALNFTDNQNIFSKVILSYLQLIHKFTGFSDADMRISLYSRDIFDGFVQNSIFHEDFSANPFHAILILLTSGFSFFVYKKSKLHPNVMLYTINLVFSFLLFSYYLKFQVSGNRLLLPLFIVWAPINILILSGINEKIVKVCIIGILLFSFYWTFGNVTRGINHNALEAAENREQIYFANDPDQYLGYAEIADKIKAGNCQEIGLNISEDTSEYPLWVMLADRKWHGRIEHINVTNLTGALEDKTFIPCAIVSSSTTSNNNQQIEGSKISYYNLPPINYIFP